MCTTIFRDEFFKGNLKIIMHKIKIPLFKSSALIYINQFPK